MENTRKAERKLITQQVMERYNYLNQFCLNDLKLKAILLIENSFIELNF